MIETYKEKQKEQAIANANLIIENGNGLDAGTKGRKAENDKN